MIGSRLNYHKLLYYCKNVQFSVCCCRCKSSISKQAKLLNKLITIKPGKKRFFQENSRSLQSVINDPTSQRRTPNRIAVLNKLLMTNVTDILSSKDLHGDLIGKGMEITNVSISRDYNFLTIYWIAKSKEDETLLQKILPNMAYSLRHELSQLYILGNVPNIHFSLDVRNSKLAALDSLISSADKGPEEDSSDNVNDLSDSFPVMTHDVYGLKYDIIADKIKKAVAKAKAPHRNKTLPLDALNTVTLNSENGSDSSEPFPMSKYQQKEAIRKFLLHRKLNSEKYRKEKKNYFDVTELEFVEENQDIERFNDSRS